MKLIKILTLLLISSSLNSCFIGKSVTVSKARKEFTVENYAIPPEFGKDKNMIFIGVLEGSKSYQKFLNRNFKKEYKGNYILLTKSELNSKKYNDLNKYRYFFSYGGGSTYGYGTSNSFKKFYVYDRLKRIKYITGIEFAYFAKAMQVYLEQLEAKRIIN